MDKVSLISISMSMIGGLVVLIISLIGLMHRQSMNKIDKLIESVTGLTNQIGKHEIKLDTGANQFSKIDAHQKEQDAKIQELGTRVAILEQKSNV